MVPGCVPASPGPAEDLDDRVRRLRRRAEAAELSLEQRLRDLSYLADLVGVGIVRLTDELRVEVANTAVHVFLRREPGSMVGRGPSVPEGAAAVREQLAARLPRAEILPVIPLGTALGVHGGPGCVVVAAQELVD